MNASKIHRLVKKLFSFLLPHGHLRVLEVVVVESLSGVQFFATLWTVAHQAPLSMEFSRQEYWSELPFPPPGDPSDQVSNPHLLHWQVNSFITEPPGKPGTRSIPRLKRCLRSIPRCPHPQNHRSLAFFLLLTCACPVSMFLPVTYSDKTHGWEKEWDIEENIWLLFICLNGTVSPFLSEPHIIKGWLNFFTFTV